MLTEDYLIRRINQAIALLLHAIGLRKDGQIEAALTDIEIALELLVGIRSSLIKNLTDESLLQLLTSHGELDYERLGLVADLFEEQGLLLQAQGQQAEARQEFLRALTFSLEVVLANMAGLSGEQVAGIAGLVRKLADQALPMPLQVNLFNFYQDLLIYDDEMLASGGLERAQVEDALEKLKRSLGV